MKQEIISRVALGQVGGVVRMLKCGHDVTEPKGSKAKDAKFALCKECDKLLVKFVTASTPVTSLDPVD